MVDYERQIRIERFPYSLTILKCFKHCKLFQVLFYFIRDFQQHETSFSRRRLTPLLLCLMRSLTALSTSVCFERGTFDTTLPVTGDLLSKNSPSAESTHSPPM